MRKDSLRNIAIIAHVDHGKTTLVDAMLQQSGTFRDNQVVEERVMDSMDLERERGITIMAKNTAVQLGDIKLNIVDTPGHADFGGEVERSLSMVDGALLLVDASEGPLPQTRFVLKKALARGIPIILVVNKIDRADARIDQVLDDVYDLFIDLGANDEQIDFPVMYTNAKAGVAHKELGDSSTDLRPLFDTIIESVDGPEADDEGLPQFLVTTLFYDSYVGQVGIGRLINGSLRMNTPYALCAEDGIRNPVKFSALYTFKGLKRVPVDVLEAGDIVAVAGIDGLTIGDTITDATNPAPLPRIKVDEPTVSMLFYVNNGPFAGREGKFVTTRHLHDRLMREMLGNVAVQVSTTHRADAYEVKGRGELQMAILIETMRREGYEFMVSRPQVITREVDGSIHEPVERVIADVPDEAVGVVTEKLSKRKGQMTSMDSAAGAGRTNIEFIIPSRGLIGYRSEFMTDTRGAGILNAIFDGYKPWFGPIPQRTAGALVADRVGKVTGYSVQNLADRGELFIEVGTEVYGAMVVGVRNRPGDLDVNITKEKKSTNHRAASADTTVTLKRPRILSLDQAIEFIAEDEVVEITPDSVRIRKTELDPHKRASARRKEKFADA